MKEDIKDGNEIALQNFLLDINCLDELQPWLGKFNIFDVLKLTRTEIRHSNVLAWLLSANETHGLGDSFIKGVIQRVVERNQKIIDDDILHELLMDFYSFSIYREYKNIDILLISDEEKTVIAIENKVGSKEHSNQLNRYSKVLDDLYPTYKKIKIFLTPEGDAPSDEKNWRILTYVDIIEILEDISQKKSIVFDVDIMIKNYIETLRRYVVNDQELKEICTRIYDKHRKALDLIFDNRMDVRSQIGTIVKSVLSEYHKNGKVIYNKQTNANSFIQFYTKEMDKLLPPLESCDSSWGDEHVYCFWISAIDNCFVIVFELGGMNITKKHNDIQQKIIAAEKPKDKRKDKFRFKRIRRVKIDLHEDDDNNAISTKVSNAIDDFLRWQNNLVENLS